MATIIIWQTQETNDFGLKHDVPMYFYVWLENLVL